VRATLRVISIAAMVVAIVFAGAGIGSFTVSETERWAGAVGAVFWVAVAVGLHRVSFRRARPAVEPDPEPAANAAATRTWISAQSGRVRFWRFAGPLASIVSGFGMSARPSSGWVGVAVAVALVASAMWVVLEYSVGRISEIADQFSWSPAEVVWRQLGTTAVGVVVDRPGARTTGMLVGAPTLLLGRSHRRALDATAPLAAGGPNSHVIIAGQDGSPIALVRVPRTVTVRRRLESAMWSS
jgi:hypothetical protein